MSPWLLGVWVAVLATSPVASLTCRCNDVSAVWGGVAYHCKDCQAVPQDLPQELTTLGLDNYLGKNLTEAELWRYRATLADLTVGISKTTRGVISSDAFLHLEKLEALYLVGNDMQHFPHLPHGIKVVDMQENQLSALREMYQPDLQELMLDTNKISQLPGLFLAEKLSTLSLFDNLLTQANLSHLPHLKVLDLGVNRLKTFPMLPSSIVVAKLGFNHISTIPKLNLPNLMQLDLSNNNISKIMNDTFKGCPQLELLKLKGNPLKYIAPSEKARLQQMKEVDLPEGLAFTVNSGVSWVWPFVATVFGMALGMLVVLMVYTISRHVRRRGYERPRKVWHVSLRTPIYKVKDAPSYKQLANEAV